MLRHFFHQKRLQRESHINPLYNEFISIPLLCPSFYSFDIPPMQVTYGWNGIYRNYAEIWQMLFHLCLLQASPDAKPDPKIAQAAEAAASLDEWFSWGLRHQVDQVELIEVVPPEKDGILGGQGLGFQDNRTLFISLHRIRVSGSWTTRTMNTTSPRLICLIVCRMMGWKRPSQGFAFDEAEPDSQASRACSKGCEGCQFDGILGPENLQEILRDIRFIDFCLRFFRCFAPNRCGRVCLVGGIGWRAGRS